MPDLRDEFEAKYQRSADDPASAEMLAIWEAAWNTATERAAKKEREDGVVVAAYALLAPTRAHDEIRIERARQMSGPDLWAVRYRGDVLNKQGEWEWEPMPSGRDEDFLARARFDSAEEGIAAAIRAREGKGGAG